LILHGNSNGLVARWSQFGHITFLIFNPELQKLLIYTIFIGMLITA